MNAITPNKKASIKLLNWRIIIVGLVTSMALTFVFSAFKPKTPKASYKVHAPFNRTYPKEDLGKVLYWEDTKKAVGAVSIHKGLLIAPMSFDFGGGLGAGCLAAYNVDDPYKPKKVFDSRDYKERYHTKGGEHYLGDLGEIHGLYFHKDMIMLSDRGDSWNGFVIVDLAPLYDDNEDTLPYVVSRYRFPDIEKSTIYDGFTFAPVWAGGKYVYAPTGSWGFFIISTEDLKNPKLLAHLTREELYNQTLRSVHAMGDLLVLSPAAVHSRDGNLVFMDVSDPTKPNLLSKHPFKTGYQGILYGDRFYNAGFRRKQGYGKDSLVDIMAYDFADVNNVKEVLLGTTTDDVMHNSEYMFLKDDNMFIGDYSGLTRWNVTNDKAKYDLKIHPQHPPGNDYGFVSPLGNLVVIGSDHNVESKFNIGCHQIEPDRTPPEVKSVYPKSGTKNVSPNVKIGISFSDWIDNACLEHGAIYIKDEISSNHIASTYSHGLGVVHVIPDEPLKKNRKYGIYLTPMLMDLVGNAYKGNSRIAEFSTGEFLANYTSEIKSTKPMAVGETVNLEAITISNENKNIYYAWNFGDGTKDTPFTKKPSIQKTFEKPGNYSITLISKPEKSNRVIRSTAVQVIHRKLPESQPISSNTLCLNKNEDRLYVVNPDNNTLTCIHLATQKTLFEVTTPKNPVAIVRVKNQLWVSCSKSDKISIYNSASGEKLNVIDVHYGCAPYGITYNEKAHKIYSAFSATGKVQEIDAETYKLKRNIQLKTPLRHIAFLPEKNVLIAPQFTVNHQGGTAVQWFDTKKWAIIYQKELQPTMDADGISNGRGFPNYMGAMAVSPNQNQVWIPAKKDNVFRGLQRDGKPLVFDQTVRSIAVQMDIDNKKEIEENRVDFDNHDFATSATYSPFGNVVYATTNGSQALFVIDAYNPKNIATYNVHGEGARGILSNSTGSHLYVHNQLSRSISIFKTTPDGNITFESKIKSVQNELLPSNVLDGKRTFNNTFKSNLSREGYMSCASCHIDGSHDGRVWDLTNLGEGLRNTIDLRGKEGMKHGTLHWTANFDEIQDFDKQIVALNEGTGFLYEALLKKHEKFYPSTSGLHKGLDNLAEYVSSLSEYPKSPFKKENGTYSKSAQKGRQHFIDLQCYSCHSGPTFTDSGFNTMHNMGTLKETSGKRLGNTLKGIDTPTLISLWQSAPYLHDGSAQTLKEVFTQGNGFESQEHKKVTQMSIKAQKEILAFLMELDTEDGIDPKELNTKNSKPKFNKTHYNFEFVYDLHKMNYPLVKVEASDADKKQQLKYKIIPSTHSNMFSIDSTSGQMHYVFEEIYLKNMANKALDSEKKFNLKVMVEDNGTIIRKDTTLVSVNIKFPYMAMTNKEFKRFTTYLINMKAGKKLKNEQLEDYETLKKKSLGYLTNEERWQRY